MTERQFFEALKKRFEPREYAMVPQVRNGTGFNNRTRTADAIAISLWPSRGIDVHGFEFKDSRSDWLKELADSEKSEEIGRYCDFWWLVASKVTICPLDEIPKGWGMICVGPDGATTVIRKAPRRESQPPTMGILASILKAAQDVVTGEAEILERIKKAVAATEHATYESLQKARNDGMREAARGLNELRETVREFEKASGITISGWRNDGKSIGEAVKFVLDGGLAGIESRLRDAVSICDHVKSVATKMLQKGDDVIHEGGGQCDPVQGATSGGV